MDNKNIYENFDWESFKETDIQSKIKKVLDLIPDDVQNILDVGCGNGLITNVLGKKYKVTGVDRSESALKLVETNKIQASADDIPQNDKSYDMVFSSELLEHLDDNTFQDSISEMMRLTKKYIFITVPNDENPDKLSIKCPECRYTYNSPNHLRSFKLKDFKRLFPEYNILKTFVGGKKVRYYNPTILKMKLKTTPSHSWIPMYWMAKSKRGTICPKCENTFTNPYRFNPLATAYDICNVIISPKKPYWRFVLMEKH